jgi:hypothetical protein
VFAHTRERWLRALTDVGTYVLGNEGVVVREVRHYFASDKHF